MLDAFGKGASDDIRAAKHELYGQMTWDPVTSQSLNAPPQITTPRAPARRPRPSWSLCCRATRTPTRQVQPLACMCPLAAHAGWLLVLGANDTLRDAALERAPSDRRPPRPSPTPPPKLDLPAVRQLALRLSG